MGIVHVRLHLPRRARYGRQAPVVIMVSPALFPSRNAGIDALGLTGFGFIVVTFTDPNNPNFDAGGPNTHSLIRNLALFAMGRYRDASGRTIQDIVSATIPGLRVLTSDVGFIGWSHGGNAVVTALEAHASALSGLAFYVSYESPAGTSPDNLGDSVRVDLGGVMQDPDLATDADRNGFPWDDARNPYYNCRTGLDLSRIAWDPRTPITTSRPFPGGGHTPNRGALFIDGNGNGRLDANMVGRRVITDLDHSGAVERDEDFLFAYGEFQIGGTWKRVYSLPVIRAAIRRGVFGTSVPAFIADISETRSYWEPRDMASHFANLKPLSNMLVCIYSGRRDHVQAQPDYPHIRAQYEGLRRGGIRWVKINPDPVYVNAILTGLPPHLPNLPPNAPISPSSFWRYTEPSDGRGGRLFVAVAVVELADRVYTNCIAHPLSSVLVPGAPGYTITFPRRHLCNQILLVPPC